jgi:hypothetical protein
MRTFLLVFAFCLAGSALAQSRTLPAQARLALMTHVSENVFDVNGREERLSPGAQIRDALNRIVMPATLPPGSMVKLLRDDTGAVHRVWILSPLEVEIEQESGRRHQPQSPGEY